MSWDELSEEQKARLAGVTRNACRTGYDRGFEEGSIAACNAILAFMYRTGQSGAAVILAAWNDGTLTDPPIIESPPKIDAPVIDTLLAGEMGGPAMDAKQARLSGFTGDACTNCQSLKMRRNGACMVCDECGTTTGCS